VIACPACGSHTESGETFCAECGSALTWLPSASSASSPEAVRAAGERKQIAVLFADVAGSMDLQEQLGCGGVGADDGRVPVDPGRGVRRFGGTVDKFPGTRSWCPSPMRTMPGGLPRRRASDEGDRGVLGRAAPGDQAVRAERSFDIR